MPPNDDLTIERFTKVVRQRMGGHAVDVELLQDDYSTILEEALRVLSRNRPLVRHAALTVTSAITGYEIVHAGLMGVLDVDFTTTTVSPAAGIDVFDPFYATSPMGGMVGQATFGELAQQKMYLKDAARITSAEPEWRGEWTDDGKYILYIQVTSPNVKCAYEYACRFAPVREGTNGMHLVPASDVDWMFDMGTAKAKQTLGRIRGKFGGVLNSDGSPNQTDAEDLIAKGEEQELALMEEIRKRRRPLPPTIG